MKMRPKGIAFFQEVGAVSPTSRGDRVVVGSPPALSLLGLLGLGLLLLGRLPT